jgi:hypothetical protein
VTGILGDSGSGNNPLASATVAPTVPYGQTGVEMLLGGTWVNITPYVYTRDGITYTRGRSDESANIEPSQMKFTVNNRDGRFSPRNPVGAYYGLIGRNTPVRSYVNYGSVRLSTFGASGDFASCVDSAGLTLTDDLDIRIDMKLHSWRLAGGLVGKFEETGNQRSYALYLNGDGTLTLYFSADGVNARTGTSTVVMPMVSGRQAVRATLDGDNSGGGCTIAFFTAPTMSGTWTQLGDYVYLNGVASIFDGTGPLVIGNTSTTAASVRAAAIYSAQVRSTINGPIQASPDFSLAADGALTLTDAQGNVFTTSGNATISSRRYRFFGETSSFPAQWDWSGRDVWSPIEAAGILRRLGQGASPLSSVLYRGITSLATKPVAYWPCEDGSFAQTFASAVPNGRPMRFVGAPTLSTYEGFSASAPIPMVGDSWWLGPVAPYAGTGKVQVRFLMTMPTAGLVNGRIIARISTGGTAANWDIAYHTGGAMSVTMYDRDGGTAIYTSGPVQFGLDGKDVRVSLSLSTVGANAKWELGTLDPLTGDGGVAGTTIAGYSVSACTQIVFGPQRAGLPDVMIGHVSIQKEITNFYDLNTQMKAYAGETAQARISRLCAENGVPFIYGGRTSTSTPVGVQRRDTLLNLLLECAEADQGLLVEPRDAFGLTFRPRFGRYNRNAAVSLSHSSGDVTQMDPVDDDQSTRNDITVARTNGSSQRAVLESGPLSVQPAPDGVGTYDDSISINVFSDENLADEASWRLFQGTIDEARYPSIGIDLASPRYRSSTTRTTDVLDVDIGDRIDVTGLPPWLAPGTVSQTIQGYTESVDEFGRVITLVGSPATAFDVATYAVDRYSSDGSVLVVGVSATATAFTVLTNDGPRWTILTADFPFDAMVGGERVTVTNITGTAATQTFTVIRSVNGIVKAQTANTTIGLFEPAVYAL